MHRFQVASDVMRDGLGVELIDSDGNVLAEIFRCDVDNTLKFFSFAEELPFPLVEKLVLIARKNLGNFEDGSQLPGPILIDG